MGKGFLGTVPGGFLFNIAAIAPDEVAVYIANDRPGSYLFAQDEEWYYAYTGATDVQLYRSQGVTEDDQAFWEQLYQFSNQVAVDTVTRNALSPYTPPAAPTEDIFNIPELPQPKMVECPICKGGRLCPQCLGGINCGRCLDMGTTICTSCSGVSHCISCGGKGYIYAGVGLAHRKERCSRCSGSGDCRTCQNTGRMTCPSCGGNPTCFFCGGLGTCSTCAGMGYLLA